MPQDLDFRDGSAVKGVFNKQDAGIFTLTKASEFIDSRSDHARHFYILEGVKDENN